VLHWFKRRSTKGKEIFEEEEMMVMMMMMIQEAKPVF
jgi:hypothetical protein